MKNTKRMIAAVSALSLVLGLTACGSKDGGDGGNNGGSNGGNNGGDTTTAAATEATEAKTLSEEDEEALTGAISMLRDIELDNGEIKLLAHYDFNPEEGKPMSTQLSMFNTKYGGTIKYYPTEWATRYDDLAKWVTGGEGIDIFPRDDESLPKGVISGMFQPVDDYIDMDSVLWKDMKAGMEVFNFNGKHYSFVTGVSVDNVVFYSRKTIEEYGYDDPWELFEQGKWNWDTFTEMLQDFVDSSEENEGLDGWWSELALYKSGGVPFIQADNGNITVNMYSPEIERAQNWMLDLYNKGLVMDKSLYEWAEQPQFMGEGKELFFICGPWHIMNLPEARSTKMDAEDYAIVPIPNAPDAEHPWQNCVMDGFCLVKGAANPMGVAMYAECCRAAALDPDADAVWDKQCREEYLWPEDVIDHMKQINKLAAQYPVFDIAGGMSSDIESITTSNQNKSVGLNAALHGVDWATTRDGYAGVLDTLVQEVVDGLAKAANS